MTIPNPNRHQLRRRIAAGALTLAALGGTAGTLAACGSSGGTAATTTSLAASNETAASSGSATDTGSSSGSGAATDGQVLPVTSNPITNTSTNQAFTIDSVLVENNEDANGKAVDDHLEIALTNASAAELSGFEVFSTYDDPTTGESESYYTALPDTFTIAAGATRVIHFDNTGATDHFPVNAYSLFSTDTNALDVTVEVSATDAAVQTATVQKDAGGAEVPD